jgi:RNA ligase (TIGR02306 family)
MMEELSVTETIEIKRRLASIRQIAAIDLIPNADAIDLATIDGWKVVVKKGEFKVNDYVVYFEIDSFIPNTIAPFLFKGRTYNGVEGERLRTKKLRGVVSQGLVLGINILPV